MRALLKYLLASVLISGPSQCFAQGLNGRPIEIEAGIPATKSPQLLPPELLVHVLQSPYQLEVNRRLRNALLVHSSLANRPAVILVWIRKNGLVDPADLSVMRSSGSLESDFACVDSIMTCIPFDSTPMNAFVNQYAFYGNYKIGNVEMSDNVIKGLKPDLVYTYLKLHPNLSSSALVTRSIPRSILNRYPGVLKPAEIDSVANLKSYKKSLFNTEILKQAAYNFYNCARNKDLFARYLDWAKFQKEHSKATKLEIIREEKILNRKYAHLFES